MSVSERTVEEQIQAALLRLPAQIEGAERDLLTATQQLQVRKDTLATKEGWLLQDGSIDGKNAEIRQAQLRDQTTTETADVRDAEVEVGVARIALARKQNEFSAAKAMAHLLRPID